MRRVPLIYSDVDAGPPDRKIVAEYMTCALEHEDDAATIIIILMILIVIISMIIHILCV